MSAVILCVSDKKDRKKEQKREGTNMCVQASTYNTYDLSVYVTNRQVRVQKQHQRELKKSIEQRPLITRRVAGFYISDYAASRGESEQTLLQLNAECCSFSLSLSLCVFHLYILRLS